MSVFSSLTEIPAHGGREYDYDTRIGKNLGNTLPGDDPKFIGRGVLHLTGRDNYDKFGKKFGKDYVSNPESLANNPYTAVKAACFFWNSRNLNRLADNDHIRSVTLVVNSGFNGYEERKLALKKAKQVLGGFQ
ncbi:glycoside hydrolase family 19 protein [Pantoea sp. BAV 3049]|uniref:glycoside hydrolase family 19 protein n=1 Tax=Pantoea sp. BAV 3049 TaxID=2654188 RepID=UPI00131D960B|nr:glycoside hydrolase family 19 protein [Pantoea sp. BAV 3049]